MTTFDTRYRTATVDGLEVFYREAGDPRPTLLLLHGFPTSSHMFRNLIDALADEYHLIAPDHIGFGRSATPAVDGVRVQLRQAHRDHGGLLDQLGLTGSPVHPRLRRPDRPAHRQPPPRPRHRADHAERQRLRRGLHTVLGRPLRPRQGPGRQRAEVRELLKPDAPAGSTPTACPPTGWTGSPPRPGCSTRPGWTAPATRRSSCSCSGTTSSTSTSTRRSRSTSAPTGRRP